MQLLIPQISVRAKALIQDANARCISRLRRTLLKSSITQRTTSSLIPYGLSLNVSGLTPMRIHSTRFAFFAPHQTTIALRMHHLVPPTV